MVDRAARDEYAEVLRHYAAGFLTRQDFALRSSAIFRQTEDPALPAVYRKVEDLYAGIRATDKWERRRRHEEAGRKATRWVRFLETDSECLWLPEPARNLRGRLALAFTGR